MSTTATRKSPLSYYQKVQLITNNTTTKKWLLHFGHYAFEETVEGAAKVYYSGLLTLPEYQAKAKKLGLIK